ncbi:hypothetical protein Pcinc_017248 [Petrolisthes cinctipes]|uniref:Uncharacterized protein n=1 Tax=Petrolisthes cinctipes TaxID=88211 RepID=A0AAE1KKX0_PETCI|nr:hypothetical protein Pcinc_017248 [Petrolisthes cinctipes]
MRTTKGTKPQAQDVTPNTSNIYASFSVQVFAHSHRLCCCCCCCRVPLNSADVLKGRDRGAGRFKRRVSESGSRKWDAGNGRYVSEWKIVKEMDGIERLFV